MSWHTRRLYALEHEYTLYMPDLTYVEARDKMVEVWRRYAPVRWRQHPPKLEFGKGVEMPPHWLCSYTEGRGRIVLAANGRDVATLLHEVAHALRNGSVSHGPKYVGLLFRLMVDEGLTSIDELALAATRHRLDPRWIVHFDKHKGEENVTVTG